MVIFTVGGERVVYFGYPSVLNKPRDDGKVSVLSWERYRRFLGIRVLISVGLLVAGFVLLNPDYYRDNWFNVYAVLVNLMFTFRLLLLLFAGRRKVPISRNTPFTPVPWLAAFDFIVGFLTIGQMGIVYALQPDPGPFGITLLIGCMFILLAIVLALPRLLWITR